MGKSSCSQDPTQDTKILFNFNIWVGYGLSLDHTGQTKLYKPQHALLEVVSQGEWVTPLEILWAPDGDVRVAHWACEWRGHLCTCGMRP
jgi:hypothetical protein